MPLLCPRHRPAGNVAITEHSLDRCVQAEKGPHLLRDHIVPFVSKSSLHRIKKLDRGNAAPQPRPQTRRVVIIIVVCCESSTTDG